MPAKEPTLLRQPAALIILFAILQLCVAFFTDAATFTHEESMWHYIGRNWFRHGLTPYAGGVDNKSPLIFAVFGVSDFLFGINFWFPRLLGVIVQSVGLLFVYRIAFRLPGKENNQTAIISTTLYGLSLLWHATGGKYVSFTETYAVTFLLASVYYYLNGKRNFVSGLLAGIAICWRLSTIFGVATITVHSLFKQRKSLLPFVAGVIAGIGALVLLALAAGINLHDLYQFGFADNFGSGSTTDHPFSWRVQKFIESFFYSELILFYAPLIAYFFTKKQHSLLTTWLIFEFIGINVLSIYAYPHFKQLLPPLCLISGIAIANLVHEYNVPFKQVMIIIWIVFFPKITEPLTSLKKTIKGAPDNSWETAEPPYPRPDELAEKNLGIWLNNYTKAGDKILVAGFGARVQLFSERLAPSIYFNVTQTPSAKKKFIEDVNRNMPEIIVRPSFNDYEKYVDKSLIHYIDSLLVKNYSCKSTRNGYAIFRKLDN